jgi:hypothetical protein
MNAKPGPSDRLMYHLVVVRPEPAGRYTASPLGVPEISAVADTPQEAIEQARQALSRWAGSLHWVAVEVPAPPTHLALAGHAKDDPDFDQYLEEIERARREAEERECSSSSSTPTT